MRTQVIVLAALLLPGIVRAEPVTIWLQDAAPDERVLERADLQTGGTLHLWTLDLLHPPSPETTEDQARLDAVAAAVEAGEARWDEFDVEREIAQELKDAVEALTLLRSSRDREDLVRALLFAGTAQARAFDPATFSTSEDAAPFRFDAGDVGIPLAWLRAWALTGQTAQRSDLPDGTAWLAYQRVIGAFGTLAPAHLTVPEGLGEVWIDGTLVTPGTVELRPGRHWVHLLRGGVVHGRAVLDVQPGQELAFPSPVDDAELATTLERVVAGRRAGFPDDVAASLAALEEHYGGGPLFLGTVDDQRPVLVSLDSQVELKDTRLVTVVLFGEMGGGVLGTTIFDRDRDSSLEPGALGFAGAVHGGLGVEVGISYFQMALGVDAVITPGRSIDYVLEDAADYDDPSGHAAVFPHTWFGLGAYAIRPTKATPVVGILGTVSYMAPGHLGYGGRITAGFPIDDHPTWFRLTAGASYGPTGLRDVDVGEPMVTAFLRVGFGTRP